jgi:hypothetical protein
MPVTLDDDTYERFLAALGMADAALDASVPIDNHHAVARLRHSNALELVRQVTADLQLQGSLQL